MPFIHLKLQACNELLFGLHISLGNDIRRIVKLKDGCYTDTSIKLVLGINNAYHGISCTATEQATKCNPFLLDLVLEFFQLQVVPLQLLLH